MDISNANRVILNVGGERHEVLWKNLNKLPHSRLGKIFYLKTQNKIEEIKDLCDDFNPTTNELFFDRNSNSFGSLLSFYRTGKLHLSDNICVYSTTQRCPNKIIKIFLLEGFSICHRCR